MAAPFGVIVCCVCRQGAGLHVELPDAAEFPARVAALPTRTTDSQRTTNCSAHGTAGTGAHVCAGVNGALQRGNLYLQAVVLLSHCHEPLHNGARVDEQGHSVVHQHYS